MSTSTPSSARQIGRSAYEERMTIEFWRSIGRGTLFLEYPLALAERNSKHGSERRRVDGLIQLDGDCEKRDWRQAPDLTGRPVVVVQTIAGKTDEAHVGQTLLSHWLLRQRFPEIGPVESVLVTASQQPFLSQVLRNHSVREVMQSGPPVSISRTVLPRVTPAAVDRLHAELGGEILLNVELGLVMDERLRADAVILAGRPYNRVTLGEVPPLSI